MIQRMRIGKYDVSAEYFSNIMSVEPALKTRTCFHGMEHDYLCHSDGTSPRDRKWCGFKDVGELRRGIEFGINDQVMLGRMINGAATLERNDESVDLYDVSGEEFDAVAYYCGERECMYTPTVVESVGHRVNLVMDLSVSAFYSAEDIATGGVYLTRLVRMLEDTGTRVEIVAANSSVDEPVAAFLLVRIKGAEDVVDYPRLIFATKPAYFRGLYFSWLSRAMYIFGYGRPGIISMDARNLREIYARILEDRGKVVMLAMRDIIEKHREVRCECRGNEAEIDAKMDAWMMEQVNAQCQNSRFF